MSDWSKRMTMKFKKWSQELVLKYITSSLPVAGLNLYWRASFLRYTSSWSRSKNIRQCKLNVLMGRKQLVTLKASDKAVQVFYFLKSASTCLEGEKNKKMFSVAPLVHFTFADSYGAISACFKRILKAAFFVVVFL